MTADPAPLVELSFGAAYERLQHVVAELGGDASMAPDRLIALLREGKGLERALRDHLERIEQDVRAIEDGDGALAFRIADAPAAPPARVPSTGPSSAPAPPGDEPSPVAPPVAARFRTPDPPAAVPPPAAPPAPPAAPTLGFPDADDDIPF